MQDVKQQNKITKLKEDVKKSKEGLEHSRAETKDSMKQSYEDIELWKQKELAKGKDPEKVEKQYQRGLKTLERVHLRLDRFNDKMDTKVDDWEFKGRLKIERAAHRKMMRKVLTSSLTKMEKILREDPNTDLRFPIAGYCAIKKKESVNKIKHPNIYREIQNWEDAIRKASKTNEYFKTFLEIIEEGNSKERKNIVKRIVADEVNKIIEEENLSIRFVSERTKIKYANLYNFLKKGVYTDLSMEKVRKLHWMTLYIGKGYSVDEMEGHFFKFAKIIRDNWSEGKDISEIDYDFEKNMK